MVPCSQSGSADGVKIMPVLTVHPSHFFTTVSSGKCDWLEELYLVLKSIEKRLNVVTDKKLAGKTKDEVTAITV